VTFQVGLPMDFYLYKVYKTFDEDAWGGVGHRALYTWSGHCEVISEVLRIYQKYSKINGDIRLIEKRNR